jgi:hypothetical protein
MSIIRNILLILIIALCLSPEIKAQNGGVIPINPGYTSKSWMVPVLTASGGHLFFTPYNGMTALDRALAYVMLHPGSKLV